MKFTNTKYYPFLVFILTILLCCIYYYCKVIFYPPAHIHLWTQSDRYALALGYVENELNLIKPQTYNLATTNGITGVDFPINEYLVAIVMKVFKTTNPSIFRFYNLIIAIIGYWALFKFTLKKTESIFKAVFIVMFVFTIPIITYYQCGFLPSATSFFFTIIGLCSYFQYLENEKIKSLIVSIAFITLAALCRTPFNIFLFAIFLHQFFLQIKAKKINWKFVIVIAIGYTFIIIWQGYKYYLNKTYGSQFLSTILPAKSVTEFLNNTLEIVNKWIAQLFTIGHYVILSVLGILCKRTLDKKKTIIFYCLIAMLLFVLYFILMNQQFIHHEYYFIDSFYIPFVFILIYLMENFSFKQQKIKSLIVFISLIACLFLSKRIQNIKYTDVNWDTAEISRKNYDNGYRLLDSLHIPTNAKILVIDAFASNYPLIQLKRKGYTLIDRTAKSIDSAMNLDYDYIVSQKIFLPSEIISAYPNFLEKVEKLGSNENLIIFKKRKDTTISKIEPLKEVLDFKNPIYFKVDSTYNKEWAKVELESNKTNGILKPNQSYGPTLIINNKFDFSKLLFEGESNFENMKDEIALCVTLHNKGKQIYYYDYIIKPEKLNTFLPFNCLFLFESIRNNYDELRFFIVNKCKGNYRYRKIQLSIE